MPITIIIIKCRSLYITHWQASDLPRLFLSARGGSLSVGGVVLRSDALARVLTCSEQVPKTAVFKNFGIKNLKFKLDECEPTEVVFV